MKKILDVVAAVVSFLAILCLVGTLAVTIFYNVAQIGVLFSKMPIKEAVEVVAYLTEVIVVSSIVMWAFNRTKKAFDNNKKIESLKCDFCGGELKEWQRGIVECKECGEMAFKSELERRQEETE